MHLTEIMAPVERGWWTYKAPEASQDASLVSLMEALELRRPRALAWTHLVFVGDTFDVDSVYASPDSDQPGVDGIASTVPGAVFKMRRLLAGHRPFLAGLARFVASGNFVTFVMGNHDRELCFPEVQALLLEALAALAPPGASLAVADRIRFEPWFVYVPGVLYAEHGQQYDRTCSYRDVLWPVIPPDRRHGPELEMSLGSLTGRMVLSRLGTFDPFDDESFLLGFGGYFRHYVEHYWPRRPFLSTYFRGCARVLREARALRKRALAAGPADPQRFVRYARAKGVGEDFVELARRLSSQPIADDLRSLLHELWIDRFVIIGAALLVLVLGIANAQSWIQGVLLLTLLPVVAFAIRALGRGSFALQERGRWGLVAEQISGHLGVPVVAFGHSHRPERRPLRSGGRYYNLGTWAPGIRRDDASLLAEARRYLVVRPGAGRAVRVAFQQWKG